jgi:hypothetical protein
MIKQSKGRIRKHLDGRTNPDRGSDAHQSKGRVSRNVILLQTPFLRRDVLAIASDDDLDIVRW